MSKRNSSPRRSIEAHINKKQKVICNVKLDKPVDTLTEFLKKNNLETEKYNGKQIIQIQDYATILYYLVDKKEFDEAKEKNMCMMVPYGDGYGEIIYDTGHPIKNLFKRVVTNDPVEIAVLVKTMDYTIKTNTYFFNSK
jgi:hypothetical protein